MKLYGAKRKDMARCKYGCCGLKGMKEANGSHFFKMSSRKRARRLGKEGIFSSLIEEKNL